MYHDYFGLKEPAFSIAVNPKYLYMSSKHKEALAHLVYGVRGSGFVLLSGEVGTGKTTIIRCLLAQLPKKTEVAFVLNPMANVDEMLHTICEELHINFSEQPAPVKAMMDALQSHLLANHAAGKRTVLLIDEAQLLSADVLEQIRLLTNLETSTDKLLQIILVGQPEINELLAQPRLRQLSQRITARFHLEALSANETELYIEHRLNIAGNANGRKIFPKSIVKKIHRFSGGIPRLINILCERLLIGAYGHNKFEVDKRIYALALAEVAGSKHTQHAMRVEPQKSNNSWLMGISACVLATLALLIAIYFGLSSPTDNSPTVLKTGTMPHSNSANTNTARASSPKTATVFSPETAFHEQQAFANETVILTSGEAYTQLFQHAGIRPDEQSHPCWQSNITLFSCEKLKVENWQDILDINRPAMLHLTNDDKSRSYAVAIGISDSSVMLLNSKGELNSISKRKIGLKWNGDITYIWRKPKGYEKPITVGSRSPVVAWVADQFALLDNQLKPITRAQFTPKLQTRIKIFQTQNSLTADGIIGEKTLMKLNDKLGYSTPLLSPDAIEK